MNMDKYLEEVNQAPVLALTLVIAVGVGFSAGNLGDSGNGMDSGLEWKNQITVEKNGEQIDQFYNTLTTQGENYIGEKLFRSTDSQTNYTSNNFTYISLGNQSDVAKDDQKLDGEIDDFNLSRSKASSITKTDSGEYKLEKKFIANLTVEGNNPDPPPSIKVNTTGLNFGESGDKLISGGKFSEAKLTDGDKITVTHEITVSDN